MIGRVDAKLAELGIRDNTLLMFLGDNGTLGSVTSRFQGADYRGGKGSTTRRGTHVPCIASWPAVIKAGRVNGDLISSTDFLPTICEAAGVPVPADTDGVSFLPQLRGERGTPRQWLYCWYSPRQRADLTVREFAVRPPLQALPRRPVLRPGRRSRRNVTAGRRLARSASRRRGEETASGARSVPGCPPRGTRPAVSAIQEGRTGPQSEEETTSPMNDRAHQRTGGRRKRKDRHHQQDKGKGQASSEGHDRIAGLGCG